MTAPNNPKVVKCTLVFARDSRVFVNTFHFERVATWTVADMTALGNLMKNWWNTQYAGQVSSAVALTQVQVRLYNPANPLAVDINVSPPLPGLNSGAPEAANVTLAVSARTGLAGRQYRGRFYVPGFSQAQCTSTDTLASIAVGGLATSAALLISLASSLGATLCIFHRSLNTFTDVTSFIVDAILDSQRRRLPGRGR